MSEQELKPCPFCGGEMKMAIDGGFTKAYRAIHKDKCKYFNPNRETRLTQEEMINIWNARPIEDALAAENEILKAKVVELKSENNELKEIRNRYSRVYNENILLKNGKAFDRLKSTMDENARMREMVRRIDDDAEEAIIDSYKRTEKQAHNDLRRFAKAIRQRCEHALKGGE